MKWVYFRYGMGELLIMFVWCFYLSSKELRRCFFFSVFEKVEYGPIEIVKMKKSHDDECWLSHAIQLDEFRSILISI